MKKILLRCLAVTIFLFCILTITSCSTNPYDEYDDIGKNISVKYLANGGIINSGAKSLVDVFSKNESGTFKLIPPESADRDKSQVTLSHSKDYQFAGWFVGTPVVDADGNPLDEDGNLVSETGKEPAYTAGKRWNFETDKLSVDPNKTYSANEPVLTLIAMWTPKFTFEIYAKDTAGEWQVITTKDAIALEVPRWSNGKINMMDFPAYPDKAMTFKAAYYDAAMANPIESSSITGEIDYETGTVVNSKIKVYTEWYEGTWFMIENAAQLYANARPSGNYMLLSDIDMTGENWPRAFSQNVFSGKFYGNGHKIFNVSANQQANYRRDSYGLFASISSSAEFCDITFENATYTISGALNQASFGLFAGQVADGAKFENVTISNGTLIIDKQMIDDVTMSTNLKNGMFDIGQLFGYGSVNVNSINISSKLSEENDKVQLTVSDEGIVSIIFLQ
jgi:hypothetical protein